MPGILGYARARTGDQDVAGQRMRLEQAGAIRVFTDEMSGKSMDRPGLAELLGFARKGDTLAIVRLDRLGRSLGELLTTVNMLRERGIARLSLEEKIDTSSAAGELVFHVFGAIAHFERRLISERARDGIAAARARGKLPGRQPLDGDKVSTALKLIAARVSPAEAARQLGIGRSTVYREMKRLGVARPDDPTGMPTIYAGSDPRSHWLDIGGGILGKREIIGNLMPRRCGRGEDVHLWRKVGCPCERSRWHNT